MVHASVTIADDARVMARRRVKRMPVVDGVGMLDGVDNRSELLKVVPAPRSGDRRRDPTQRHRGAAARRADGRKSP
ncbi:hypothetical protein [Streptomyces sp. NPDC002133]|uniref:hypothetical protein n=1 Tax=Streptomyces sp. NPDC002133 TaxID=3154409 RepID=UPI0033270C26